MRDKAIISETVPAVQSSMWRGTGRIALLVVGDALCFLAFASAGRTSHHEITSPLANLATTASVAFPFALSWFAVSPFVGAFRRSRTDSWRKMLTRAELAWLCAYPLALVLRVLIAPDHSLPLTFAIIILISNAIFLGVWRSLFALGERLIARAR